MIVAGIDVGSKNTRVVVLRGKEAAARVSVPSGFEPEASARLGMDRAAAEAGVKVEEIAIVIATGVGRKAIPFADDQVTAVAADAQGAFALHPSPCTVIDIGADEARAIRLDATGRVADFAANEKCAAGAGAFLEAMSRALEVDLERFGALALESTATIPMNAQCTVFAESEVVSLIHSNVAEKDIAKAVHDAMAGRVAAMARRAGVEGEVVMVGAVARNPGFVRALGEALGVTEVRVVDHPEYVGAYGAALIAAERARATGGTLTSARGGGTE